MRNFSPELVWVPAHEPHWTIRIKGLDVIGRDLPDDLEGPRRRFHPCVEVELADAQVSAFRQMLVDLEGHGHITIGRVQGHFD